MLDLRCSGIAILVGMVGGQGVKGTDAGAPRVRRSVWPGAVTVTPRPAPDSVGAPLRTTLYFEIEAGADAEGAGDPVDVTTLGVSILAGEERRELLRGGRFTGGATGRVHLAGPSFDPRQPIDPLAVYVVLPAPLPAATRCEVRVEARSAAGVSLAPDASGWSFTTRVASNEARVRLRGDASRRVRFEQRIFSGLLKPSFDTSELFGQTATYELMASLDRAPAAADPTAPRSNQPEPRPLQRDWPLCGDYWTVPIFDGDPNVVREQETRRVVRIADVAEPGAAGELELAVAPLTEAALYGIALDRPLAPDFPVGCTVLHRKTSTMQPAGKRS